MSVATDIAAVITTEIGGGVAPWSAVGSAVAPRCGRTLYYFSAAAAGTFAQSLQGAAQTPSVLTASPTNAIPAIIAQAAMPVGVPNLAIWPAHTTLMHLWTFAPLLPTGEKYSILATLKQVDVSGAVIATLRAYPINGDVEFPDDIWSPNWARTDLAVDMAQLQGDAGLRLEIDLTLYTSCASALVVQLQIGGPFASYLDTSLTAAGGGVSSVESTDGSIVVTNAGSGVQNIETTFSIATPTVDGGEGSPGDPADKTSAKGTHQHPAGPVTAVTSTLYAVPDNAGSITITPPAGEGSSYLNAGSLTSVYPASGSFVQAAFEPNVTTFYVRADGTLGTTPPSGSGFLSQTFTSVGGGGEGTGGSGATIAFGNAGYPNLVDWPGGTAPVTIYARIASLPDGYDGSPFPLTLVLFRSDASNVEDTIAEYGTLINVANLPTDGSWAALNVSVPVTAISGGNASDILGYFVEVTSGNASAGAVLEVAYGGSQVSIITLPFPPPGSDNWAGMARLPFISLADVPGLLTWNAGNVGVLVNCQMSGGIAGHVYEFKVQLLRVTGATSSVIYEGNGVFASPGDAVTSSPQVFAFAVPVQVLVGLTSDQLVLNIVGTSDPGGVPAPGTVQLQVNTGGVDPSQATQIQTLFVPGGGSGATGDHQLQTNRGYSPDDVTDCHPMSAITPGRVHTPTGATVTSSSGVFAMGGSNSVVLAGSEDLLGIATDSGGADPWQNGDCVTILFLTARNVINGGSPGTGFAPFALGSFGGLTGQNLTVTADSVAVFCYLGGNWRLVSAPEIA